jgi:CubicO group peptidase (beta-lactamase class C family)
MNLIYKNKYFAQNINRITLVMIAIIISLLIMVVVILKKNSVRALYYRIAGLSAVAFEFSSPEEEGVDSRMLNSLSQELQKKDTHAFVVVRGGHIVHEWYSNNYGTGVRHWTAAMAKATTGIPVLLVALSDNKIKLDDPLWKYYPELKNDLKRSKIRIKDLAYHTSGIENVSFGDGNNGKLNGWKKAYYENRAERFMFSLKTAPITFIPGTEEGYSGVGYYALAYALTKSLQGSPENDFKTILRDRIMKPLNIPDACWI